jgi:[ribosomal protein S5]-alanine N-acetyltransferase
LSPRPIEVPVEGLTDGIVRVRLGADADVDRITELVHDAAITRWTTIPPGQDADGTRAWMHRGMAGMATGTDLALVIADAASGAPLGTIGLHEINRAAGRAVAGYAVARESRSRGIARRALRLICAFGFAELSLGRIEATIEPENVASRAVAEAVGFREEGLLRSYMTIAGARRDMVMYGLLPGDLRGLE